MTKYTVAARRRVGEPEHQISPIWRGIGCIMFMVIPVVAYVAAAATVQLALDQNWPLPYQLLGNPVMPPLLMASPGLAPVMDFIQAQQNLYAILLIAVLYIVILSSLISVIYSFIYRYVGPPRYGPLDMPASSAPVKHYKR